MKKYTTVMQALGVGCGIDFKFGGTIASTLDAHRVVQWAQEKYGAETAEKVVMCESGRSLPATSSPVSENRTRLLPSERCRLASIRLPTNPDCARPHPAPAPANTPTPPTALYHQYFSEEQHPSSSSTLITATRAAGIPDESALPVIEDHSEGLMEVKMLMREQASNGVDAVPYVTVEGKRRDFTLEGAKEVGEYVKCLEQVVKESE